MGFRSWFRGEPRTDLLSVLLEDIRERRKALMEAESKRAEVEMRKAELEAQYAETLAKARNEEREAKLELRRKAREYGLAGQQKRREIERAAKEQQGPPCKVCENPHSMELSAFDVGFHASGHNAAYQLPMEFN